MGLVIGKQQLVESVQFHVATASGRMHGERQHVFGAAADHRLDLLDRQQRAPRFGERVVHRRRQVAARVEKGAVEVETDDPERKIHHIAAPDSSALEMARPSWQGGHMGDAMTQPIAAIILAAGKGTRMKSDLHKVLHPIAGRPMLLHLIDSVAALEPARTVVVTGVGREQVESAVAPLGIATVLQAEQLGTGHAVNQTQQALAGFEGDVLILYGDVPLVSTATMRRMLDRLRDDGAPATVVLGFRPVDPGAYGRVIANRDGRIEKMVEYKDASPEERAETLCNSGLMAVRSSDLFRLLDQVGNDNAAGEYYLPDIVMLAAAEGRFSVVIETDAEEVAGVNSRGELAVVEAQWQASRRAAAMSDGATLIAPETVWFAHDTTLGRDVVVEPHVFFGPRVSVGDGAVIHGFSHIHSAAVGARGQVWPH